jgi:hypothetical protein
MGPFNPHAVNVSKSALNRRALPVFLLDGLLILGFFILFLFFKQAEC